MKTFIRDYDLPALSAPAYRQYFGGLVPCVYDIETSGLSGNTSKVILTALLVPTDCGVRVTQFLAEDHFEEDQVLIATLALLREQSVDYLVTYNGHSFDVPFTNQRLDALCLSGALDLYDLDLYRFLKRRTVLPDELDSMRQKSVEAYYGIASWRKDTISGRESVSLYNQYALNGSGMLEKVILTHNREDVLQLYRLLLLTSQGDFAAILKSGDLHESMASYGFPACGGRYTVRTGIRSDALRITGRQHGEPISRVVFADSGHAVSAEFKRATASFEVSLPLYKYGNSLYAAPQELGLSAVPDGLQSLPGYINGYLILKEDGTIRYEDVNALSEMILTDLTAPY
ncbi:MAG: ribonuclease H-like domain-containing protein [Mogibacterium sp.]|nr:ribonuclease H-like domain-containing protein [Mogibacterium sp.]